MGTNYPVTFFDITTHPIIGEWTDIEVDAFAFTGDYRKATDEIVRVDNDEEAKFFGVYIRYKKGGVDWIADFGTRERAERFAELLLQLAENYKPE